MKKTRIILAALFVICAALTGLAGDPFTTSVTLGTTTGTGSYTNTRDYKAIKLLSIEVFNSAAAANTVTVTRVRSDRTNTVATITFTNGSTGSWRNTNAWPLWYFKGDVFSIASTTTTNATVEITGETN